MPDPGAVIDGKYAVEVELGRGAMGVIYLARDVGLRRLVAVKVMAPAIARDPDTRERFQREATALANVRHDHVAHVYSFGPHERSFFFAMEYIRGRNLDEIVSDAALRGETLPVGRAIQVLKQVGRALHAVHGAHMVHRDVKPSNVVLEEATGRAVLIDFGLAQVTDAKNPKITMGGGTPAYMAPEQAAVVVESTAITARADIYAFGCSAYEVFTGRPPFVDDDPYEVIRRHAEDTAAPMSQLRAELAPLDDVIAKAIEKKPENRHESVLAMMDALTRAGVAWGGPPRPPPRVGGASEAPPAKASAVAHVLVVGRDVTLRETVARAAALALTRVPTHVELVASAALAVATAMRQMPDLVVLEDLGGASWPETIATLRALPHGERFQLVVVGGPVASAQRAKASRVGAHRFLTKPVDVAELVGAIAAAAPRQLRDTLYGDA